MTNTTKQPISSTDTVQIDKESLQVLVSTAQMYGPDSPAITDAIETGTSALDTTSHDDTPTPIGELEKQSQEMEDLGDGYYRITINKDNLTAAYESQDGGEHRTKTDENSTPRFTFSR